MQRGRPTASLVVPLARCRTGRHDT